MVRGAAYTHDNRGNLTSDGTWTYSYDGAGRMVRAEKAGSVYTYTYNGDGLLVAESIDGVETVFIPLALRVTWDLSLAIPPVLATSDGTKNLYGLERIGVEQGGAWRYTLADALGSVRQWTDPAGGVLGVQSYGPFGEPREPVGTPPWGFTGEWQDPAGMVYLRARWYNPYLNRFVQPDTVALDLGDPQSINRFTYARNNPTRYTDPTGHYIFEEGPEDPWHVFDPRVRSQYWYNQPGWEPEEPSDAEIIVAMTSPLWVPAAVVGAGALVADVAVPAAQAAGQYAATSFVPAAQRAWQWASEALIRAFKTCSPWARPPLERGQVIEDMLGRNLARSFPVIDRWEDGVVTSIKSVDLSAATYQEAGALTSRVQGYVQSLASYQGQAVPWGDVQIAGEEITGRTLQLAIPPGASAWQMAALQALQQSANRLGVALQVVVVP